MVTVYDRDGTAARLHEADARDAVRSGRWSYQPPEPKPDPEPKAERPPAPARRGKK